MKQPELDLFDPPAAGTPEWIGKHTVVLPGFALAHVEHLLPALRSILRVAPFRNQLTPGGRNIEVAITNCGALGWISDRHGYRYSTHDPLTGKPWPSLPALLAQLAEAAATAAGFQGFEPDACLINHYLPGHRLTLHQDRNERDFSQPIVSVSLGLPAVFLYGGHTRSEPTRKVGLRHGDVMVWGGEDRLRFHGVNPLKDGEHALLGPRRINLTLRKAGQAD
ncbi:DNA oxidative demethylase AlkB [Pseudomonas aegrilactucae]|uniref:DNA oxidative demethylase AlkB n=1 Tax=Pseudomonas aegrilactucae TaxID=2854028 RepID=A0A9Q2XP29_9PSED|nr:DNA oxidative demethylase AlkB [Pseudomonas aegrilactucae]MBV6290241.1 DNA oxidative demethylase AlkB [Pseudomonas aegrilactucae]